MGVVGFAAVFQQQNLSLMGLQDGLPVAIQVYYAMYHPQVSSSLLELSLPLVFVCW